ncbi:hypothetical protein FAJ36_05685 [Streptococcus suis]|uniref:Uncharacterized protein n=1 Tax=Streptococcus suis TaxID=1307 RepID=A0A4T2H1S5_STRSU|nr:hypothetical protein FAJ36_05685 [Streptococcus suis]
MSFACGLSIVLGLLINTNKFGAKSPAPLLRVRVNIPAQWLIVRFVRVLHSKSELINFAGV